MKEDDVLSQSVLAAGDTAAKARRMKGANVNGSGADLLEHIQSSLNDDKAEDIVIIPLAGKSEMADHMVVCSGRSSRQVVAIAENLHDRLKRDLGLISKLEGKDQGDWVLIDAGDVIVHVFRPEVREFYQLEKMWMDPSAAKDAGKATAGFTGHSEA